MKKLIDNIMTLFGLILIVLLVIYITNNIYHKPIVTKVYIVKGEHFTVK